MLKGRLEFQLREIGQISGANWAVWLEWIPGGWKLCATYHLTPAIKSAELEYLKSAQVNTWLGGAMVGQRSRVRTVPVASKLHCKKLGCFPDPSKQRPILVGAEVSSPTGTWCYWCNDTPPRSRNRPRYDIHSVVA